MKKIVAGIVIVAAAIGIVVFSVKLFTGPKKLAVQTVSRDSIAEIVDANGTIHGNDTVTYYAGVAAPIDIYDIEVGDSIQKGQMIVSYNVVDLQNSYSQAVVTTKQASDKMNGELALSHANEERYEKALEEERAWKMAYENTRYANDVLNVSQYKDNYVTTESANAISRDMAFQTATLNSKEYELSENQYFNKEDDNKDNEIKENYDELSDCSESIAYLDARLKSLPQQAYSPDEYAASLAYQNLLSDMNRYMSLASTQRTKYEGLALNGSQQASLSDAVDIAKLTEDICKSNLDIANEGIVAISGGVVIESYVESGAVVNKGTPICKIENTDDYIVKVGLSKFDISNISIGQRAEIKLGYNEYEGVVDDIDNLASDDDSDNAKIQVSVRITNPDDRIYLGLEAEVKIYTVENDDTVVIPYSAYRSDKEGDFCYVIRNGIIEKQYIVAGIRTNDAIEVLEGVNEQDQVITDNIPNELIGKKAQAK